MTASPSGPCVRSSVIKSLPNHTSGRLCSDDLAKLSILDNILALSEGTFSKSLEANSGSAALFSGNGFKTSSSCCKLSAAGLPGTGIDAEDSTAAFSAVSG